MKISDLNVDQKRHLEFILESKTNCGEMNSIRMARGDFGDLELLDIFKRMNVSDEHSGVLVRKVICLQ